MSMYLASKGECGADALRHHTCRVPASVVDAASESLRIRHDLIPLALKGARISITEHVTVGVFRGQIEFPLADDAWRQDVV